MSALTADFNSPAKNVRARQEYIAADAAVIFRGGLVQLDASGNATPASGSSVLKIVGRAVTSLDGTEPSGSKVIVEEGDVFLNLSGSAAPTQANVGLHVYAEDDNTVATTDTLANAGILVGLVNGPFGQAGALVRVTLEATDPVTVAP